MKKKEVSHQKVLICCGGGIDSSALIHYYTERKYLVRAIHFDYGHSAYKEEKKSLDALSRYYEIEAVHKKISPSISNVLNKRGELLGRNALFLLSALNNLENNSGLISIGIHSGTVFYDCSPSFVEHMQLLFDGYSGGTVLLDAPFLAYNKSDVILWARKKGVPLEITYSCQKGNKSPCGKCPSCTERKKYGL